jgi:hypothetical protein
VGKEFPLIPAKLFTFAAAEKKEALRLKLSR